MTKVLNHLYYVVGILLMIWTEFGNDLLPILPEKWRHVVTVAIGILMYLKSHRNLFQNPDGTPATHPYKPTQPQECTTCEGEGWLMKSDGEPCPDCQNSEYLGGTGLAGGALPQKEK